MKENPRDLPTEDTQRIRDSVARTDTPLARALADFLRRVEAQSHIPPSKVKFRGRARPILTAPDNRIDPSDKPPIADEVREVARRDAPRVLGSFFRKVQQQRGIPVRLRNVRVKRAA